MKFHVAIQPWLIFMTAETLCHFFGPADISEKSANVSRVSKWALALFSLLIGVSLYCDAFWTSTTQDDFKQEP